MLNKYRYYDQEVLHVIDYYNKLGRVGRYKPRRKNRVLPFFMLCIVILVICVVIDYCFM